MTDERLPLTIVTGFLGSGKTTLIRRYVETGQGRDTGIVVNEFGEAGVDHRLFVHAAEQIELLSGGCLCCARRTDVARAIHDVVRMAQDGGVMRRAILETSGMADPAPLVATLAQDPWLAHRVKLASVVAVVDAVAGIRNLATRNEARRQVSVADTIVITKGDLRAARPFEEIANAIRAISPDVRILDAQSPDFDGADILSGAGATAAAPSRFVAEGIEHSGNVGSFVLTTPETVDWPAFTIWLTALLHAHGERILRVKGLLRTSSTSDRIAIHGVQHVMHPPTHLPDNDPDQPSQLVFITDGIARAAVERSFLQNTIRRQVLDREADALTAA